MSVSKERVEVVEHGNVLISETSRSGTKVREGLWILHHTIELERCLAWGLNTGGVHCEWYAAVFWRTSQYGDRLALGTP